MPMQNQEIIDSFLWTKENKVITRDYHHVPGLANFSHWDYKSATPPAFMHYHKNIFEFHCMIRGRRKFELMEDGKLYSFTITGNQLGVTFPEQLHGYADAFLNPYEFYSFQIDISTPDNMLGLNKDLSHTLVSELNHLRQRMSQAHNHRLNLGTTHLKLIQTAFTLFSTFNSSDIQAGMQFLNCFIFNLKYLNLVSLDHKIDRQILLATKYVRDNVLNPIKTNELANIAGYSNTYFKAKFKTETGMTPADYIKEQRLEYAKRRLIESDASITKIALELGFSSSSYFCAFFKKQTAYTPMFYRMLHKG